MRWSNPVADSTLFAAFKYVKANAKHLSAEPDLHFAYLAKKASNYDPLEKWPWGVNLKRPKATFDDKLPRLTPRLLSWILRVATDTPARHMGFNYGEPSESLAIAIICHKLGYSYPHFLSQVRKMAEYEATVRALELSAAPRESHFTPERWLDGILGQQLSQKD